MLVPEVEERLTLGAERIPEGATARRDFALDEELVAVRAREPDPFVHLVVLACLEVEVHEKSEEQHKYGRPRKTQTATYLGVRDGVFGHR